MDSSIHRVGEWLPVPAPHRDRRPRQGAGEGEAFRRELDDAGDDDQQDLRDEVVHPRPRPLARHVAPPAQDEVGLKVDVEA